MSVSSAPRNVPGGRPVPRDAAAAANVRWAPSTASYWGIRLIALTIGIWLASLAVGFEAGLALLTLTGFAAAVMGLVKPALGALGVVMLCTLDPVSRMFLLTGGLFRWNTFNYWLVLVMLFHVGWLAGLSDLRLRLLQGLLALLTVELAFSSDVVDGVQHIVNLAIVFGLLIYLARARWDRHVWYWSAMVSAVLAAMGSLVFFLQEETLPQVNANAWSFFPLTALFATCAYFGSRPGGWRARGLVPLALVNTGFVFLSGSRGSFLVAVVCLAFVMIRLQRVKAISAALIAGLFVALVVGSVFTTQQGRALFRVTALFDPDRSLTERTSGRWDLAAGGWQIFLDHPLGVGTGGFPQAWATLSSRTGAATFRGWEKQAHSGWIKVLAENGIPGILLLIGFVASFAFLGWRRRRAGVFLPGLLVTVVLGVAFLADEFQGKGLWYLCAAVIVCERQDAAGVAAAHRQGLTGAR